MMSAGTVNFAGRSIMRQLWCVPYATGSVALVFLLLAVPARASNLLVNGGFEEPLVPDHAPYVHLNGTELTGWSSFSNYRGTVLFSASQYDPVSEGAQAVQVEVPGDWISQSFATVIGQNYRVSFDQSAYTFYGGPGLGFHSCPCESILEVIAGPVSGTFTGSSAGYVSHNMSFKAYSPVTTVKFQNPALPAGWGNYPHLDNVVVEAVPEPSSLLFLIVALAVLGLRARSSASFAPSVRAGT
jgi:hypothetical protein